MLGLGVGETVFIFVLALLVFGPKKLPELGKTIGKAMTEFRRASSELKATFDREMQSIERENESLKNVTRDYQPSTYAYNDYADYGEPSPSNDQPAGSNTVSASAPQGADTPASVPGEPVVASSTPEPAKPGSTTTETKAV